MADLTTLKTTRDVHIQIVTDLIENAKENETQKIFILLDTLETEKKLIEKLNKDILTATNNVEEIKLEIEKTEKYKFNVEFAIQNYKNIISNKAVNEPKHVMQMLEKNSNRFADSKNFIQSIADVSLMMANISQLRAVVGFGDANQFYIHLLILVMLSIVSHIFFVFFSVIRSHFLKKHNIALDRAKADIEKQQAKTPTPGAHITTEATTSVVNQENEGITNTEHRNPPAESKIKNKRKKVVFCCCCTKEYRGNEYTSNDLCQCPHCHTDLYLGYICNILVFITICANIGITGIGIS